MKKVMTILAMVALLALGTVRGEPITAISPTGCVPAPSGLVSWWPFDDGTATDIADGNDGVVLSGTLITGKVDGALSFSGTTRRIDVPDNLNLRMNNPFTIEGWVRLNPPGTGAQQMIIVKGGQQFTVSTPSGSGCPCNYDLQITPSGEVLFEVRAADLQSVQVFSTTQVIDGLFHHIAGVFDGEIAMLFIDGVLEGQDGSKAASFRTFGVITSPDPINIGYYNHISNGPSAFFLGTIDEVGIYNRALFAEEIAAIFNAGSAGKCKVTTVAIDIKPGSFPNSINCRDRNGVIPVAILTTRRAAGESVDFDATTVDPLSVRFGRTGTEAAEIHNTGHIEDVDGDGDLDLVLHFRFGDTGIRCGDIQARLTGRTFSGQRITGTDSIRTVGG